MNNLFRYWHVGVGCVVYSVLIHNIAYSTAHAENLTLPLGLDSSKAALTGFWDTRVGVRTQDDKHQKQTSLAETRIRLNLEIPGEHAEFRLSSDLIYDDVVEHQDIDLETGAGVLDLREASLLIKPSPNLDIKIGRQTLSWGTGGGLLSINDRFPKDFRSLFIGRDIKYLKAPPVDAVKLTKRSKLVNLDVIYSPRFDANRLIDGSRLSFFNPSLQQLSGNQHIIQVDKPDNWFEDDEINVRLSRNIKGFNSALYVYRGFWKSPAGFDPRLGKAIYPKLGVYGASVGGIVGRGLGKMELGYFDSMDDADGNNPFIRNSEIRFSTAYKQRLGKTMTLGAKYYVEHRRDHEKQPQPRLADENRHVLSSRFTHSSMQQDLKLTLLAFYSPSDKDGYLRPMFSYQLDNDWIVDGGANIFFGDSEQTTFGQLENNSNVYLGIRYRFSRP
ncbi:MAG: hypothetical protein V3U84_05670 [Thiotrichaceae bacterium]